MIVLVLNCGSSSIKYQVIDMLSNDTHHLLAKGLVERIGLAEGILTHKPEGKERFELQQSIPDHSAGISLILSAIADPNRGVITSLSELQAVGHRVAHGGEFFSESAVVTPAVIEKIRSCFELAPLHNPANLQGILAMEQILPGIPQVAVFDTSFHQTIPAENFLYALPYGYYEKDRIRKYGFHGTSHKFVGEKGCKMAGLDFKRSKVITCHIGNGASITAIRNGKSYDTSMGFTPVDGLIMGTRTGELDPGALLYIGEKKQMDLHALNNLINKESGMLGITGISSDMRDIEQAVKEGNKIAATALEMYKLRIKKFVGAYAALLGGVELIVFTGGVGENDFKVREGVCQGLEFMGVEFDSAANDEVRGVDKMLTKPTSKVKVAVVTTDEELVIASDTFRLTQK